MWTIVLTSKLESYLNQITASLIDGAQWYDLVLTLSYIKYLRYIRKVMTIKSGTILISKFIPLIHYQ